MQETQEDLCGTKAEKEELERAVTRGKEWLDGLREYGDTNSWKKKYSDQIETKELKMEEQIRVLETEIKHKVKKIKEVEKKNALLEDRSSTLEETLKEGEKELQAIVELRRQVDHHYRCICSFLTLSLLALHEQARAKLEERNIAAKDMKRALEQAVRKAEISEDKTKAALKVRIWVRVREWVSVGVRSDTTRQDKTRQDKTRQHKTRQEKTTPDNTGQHTTRQDKTRHKTKSPTILRTPKEWSIFLPPTLCLSLCSFSLGTTIFSSSPTPIFFCISDCCF